MPLPWDEVNAADSHSVARLIDLPRARVAERRKWGCPFCGSSDALHAYPGVRGGFGCWAACGADRPNGCRGYSNIDVAGQLWGTPLPETCRRLAGLLGIVYEDGPPPPGCTRPRRPAAPAPQKAESPQQRNLAAVRAIPGARLPAELYGDLLSLITLTRRGACYLRDDRRLDARAAAAYGYRSVDTARQWAEIARFLAVSYREEELVAAGFPPEGAGVTLPFGGRIPALVIPFVRAGEVIGLRFRSLLPDRREFKHNRYRSLKGAKPWWPYNADALGADHVLHVVEGEINTETFRQRGHHAIGTYGAGIWLLHWTPALADASLLAVWFDATDPKGAGDRGANALRRNLVAAFGSDWVGERWRRVVTPADPNDLHRRGLLSGLLRERPWLATSRPIDVQARGGMQA